jgi:hypothetical protein
MAQLGRPGRPKRSSRGLPNGSNMPRGVGQESIERTPPGAQHGADTGPGATGAHRRQAPRAGEEMDFAPFEDDDIPFCVLGIPGGWHVEESGIYGNDVFEKESGGA